MMFDMPIFMHGPTSIPLRGYLLEPEGLAQMWKQWGEVATIKVEGEPPRKTTQLADLRGAKVQSIELERPGPYGQAMYLSIYPKSSSAQLSLHLQDRDLLAHLRPLPEQAAQAVDYTMAHRFEFDRRLPSEKKAYEDGLQRYAAQAQAKRSSERRAWWRADFPTWASVLLALVSVVLTLVVTLFLQR